MHVLHSEYVWIGHADNQLIDATDANPLTLRHYNVNRGRTDQATSVTYSRKEKPICREFSP